MRISRAQSRRFPGQSGDLLPVSGGNRRGPRRTYVNLAIVMLLGGLWHGASWNFVILGGLHGLYLAVHKAFAGRTDKDVISAPLDAAGRLGLRGRRRRQRRCSDDHNLTAWQ